jgi:hypothetical protein
VSDAVQKATTIGIAVGVTVYVINLAVLTFVAHRTVSSVFVKLLCRSSRTQGRQWHVGFLLGLFFGVFGWCCFCCFQPKSQTIVLVQQNVPYTAQPMYGQPNPLPYKT